MANIGQATFVGADVIILCHDEWTCCQREQAKAKVEGYNKECPLSIRSKVTKSSKRAKKNCQARANTAFLNAMKENPASGSKAQATSPCLAEQLENDWNNNKKGLKELKVEMDHPIEVKVGGPSSTTLKALDKKINNFMGNAFAKNTGNNMLKAGETEIKSVSLVCEQPCKPPKAGDENKDYSTGEKKSYPENPPNVVSPRIAAA